MTSSEGGGEEKQLPGERKNDSKRFFVALLLLVGIFCLTSAAVTRHQDEIEDEILSFDDSRNPAIELLLELLYVPALILFNIFTFIGYSVGLALLSWIGWLCVLAAALLYTFTLRKIPRPP